jgi:D-aspartate ligase
MKDYAVVLGLSGINGLGTTRSLGRENIPVHGIHIENKRTTPTSHSRYIRTVQTAHDEKELLNKLIALGDTQSGRGVLFPTNDNYVLFCARNVEILREKFHVPISETYPLETLMHKENILPIAVKSGFSVPAHAPLSSKDAEHLEYPVIVKPTGIEHNGKVNIFIYETPEKLRAAREKLLEHYNEMAVEEFIPGDIQHHYEVHSALGPEGPVIGMILQKQRYFTIGEVPTGSFVQSISVPKLVKPVKRFTEDVAFTGPMDINLIKREGTNDFYFIEANYRTSANLALDTVAGVNLPALVFHQQTGNIKKAKKLATQQIREGVAWIDEGKDWQSLVQRRVSPLEYLASLGSVKACGFFDWQDPAPFISAILDGSLIFKPKQRADL